MTHLETTLSDPPGRAPTGKARTYPIGRRQLYPQLAKLCNIPEDHAERHLDALLTLIQGHLRDGRNVSLPGIGVLTLRPRPARQGGGHTVTLDVTDTLKDALCPARLQ